MPNANVNKVVLADGSTPIDLTDTTATADDVASGKVFYAASGARTLGTASGGGAVTTWYGTCSTAAGTAAKVVACDDFDLVKGAIIGILFTTANTAATPTLNVNSTGAKTVYIGAATLNSTTNSLKWSANSMLYFMYDGTYFRYIADSAGAAVAPRGADTWYATSSTAAATAAKVGSVANFVLTRGAVVAVTFTYGNTVSAAITLNCNSTGAKTIYVNNAATSASNPLLWDAGETLTFVYSGSYYYLVARSSAGAYELPTASASQLGGVKVGSGLSIDSSGVLSASGGGGGASYSTTTATIPTTGWSNNQRTVNVAGVTASNDVIVAPAPASAAAWAAAGIVCTAQGAGTLTFTRTAANTAALTANVMVLTQS